MFIFVINSNDGARTQKTFNVNNVHLIMFPSFYTQHFSWHSKIDFYLTITIHNMFRYATIIRYVFLGKYAVGTMYILHEMLAEIKLKLKQLKTA